MPPGEIDFSHPGWWALGWAILSNLLAGAVALYVWLTGRHAASMARVDGLERELTARLAASAAEHDPLRVAVARLEEGLRHAPSDDDIARVHSRIDKLAEGVSEIRGSVKRIEHAVDLMHSYLLEERTK